MELTFDEARRRVLEELNSHPPWDTNALEMVLMDEFTTVKPYGWVFYCNSRVYRETGNFLYALGGNGPVIFERATGRITLLGTAYEPEVAIARFEAEAGLPSA